MPTGTYATQLATGMGGPVASSSSQGRERRGDRLSRTRRAGSNDQIRQQLRATLRGSTCSEEPPADHSDRGDAVTGLHRWWPAGVDPAHRHGGSLTKS